MRMAYVCADPGIPVFGCKGASVHVQEVLRGLLKQGVDVTLIAQRFDGEPPAGLEGLKCLALPPLPRGSALERAQGALTAGHVALRAALQSLAPLDWVYERYSLWSDAGMAYAREQGIPGLLEVNAPLIEEQRTHRELPLEHEARRVAQSVFADATAMIAVSPGVKQYLQAQGADPERVQVVANGVDPARFAAAAAGRAGRMARRAHDSAAEPAVIGFLGTLKPWHGLPTLVQAFERLYRQYPHTRLLVVGDGPEQAAIRADLVARGLEAYVQFAGAVEPAQVPGWLAQMDVAVAPYPQLADFYFSPLKIYEYMAAGLPVVATRVGHLESVVLHGETGLLVPPQQPEQMAEAIAQLLNDPAQQARMGQSGRRLAEQERSWDAVVQRIVHTMRTTPLQPPRPLA